MTRTATLTGNLRVADSTGLALIDTPISSESAEVNQQLEVETIVAASATDEVIGMGGISNATMIDLSFTDESTGLVTEATPKINGVAFIACTRLLVFGNDISAGITAILLSTPAGNNVVVKLIIAGQ